MKNVFNSLMMFLVLILAACASQTADDSNRPTGHQVATVVHMTLQALSSEVAVAAPNTPAVEAPVSTLPHSLYFLGKDDGWVSRVYRLERDGRTKTQLTFERMDVTDFDLSAADGSVAYVLENQLLLVNADGSNRRLVLDGGPRENNPWVTRPVVSRDGRLLDKTLKVVKREHLWQNILPLVSGSSTGIL